MGTPLIISIISAGISAIALLITLAFNLVSHKQYISSLNPLLSFRMTENDHLLYLSVTNTGKSAALCVNLNIKSIEDNGDKKDLHVDRLFINEFELYPGEMVQGMIAIYGQNVCTYVFPYIKMDVSYLNGNTNEKIEYKRTVTFTSGHESKISADVKVDTKTINENMSSLSRSNIRIANYLDGHQLAHFDQINLLAGNSLQNDLDETFTRGKKIQVKDRQKTIEKALGGKSDK